MSLTGAVFLSYASGDAVAAERIATSLRTAGIEVWFDRSELRGGDAWDTSIRKQIKTCALFIPVISHTTHDRIEGYFRLEWKLAIDRSHLMAADKAFLLPVVIDDTRDDDERVPERFREVQWTHLPKGETTPAFVGRIRGLLSGSPTIAASSVRPVAGAIGDASPASRRRSVRQWGPKTTLLAVGAVAVVAAAYFVLERFTPSRPTLLTGPPNSIAVLPLANESGDPNQQYFSDGLSEDLITTLSQFPGLKVIGHTSSFKFRNSKEDSGSIGTKLGVAHLLEGSVRRSGDVVRVSTELINASDGSTQWSARYDRPYKDLFALQDDITRAVAAALKAKLLLPENAGAQSDRPPSGNLEAYNRLLRGRFYDARDNEAGERKAIEEFTAATQLDPRYAVAWVGLSTSLTNLGEQWLEGAAAQKVYAQARAAAEEALTLEPDLAAAHSARGFVLRVADFNWRGAEAEYRRAVELAPDVGSMKFSLANQLATIGQVEEAIELTRQALSTEPLRAGWHEWLAMDLLGLNRLDEAEPAIHKAIELQPHAEGYYQTLTMIAIKRGDPKAALAAALQEPVGDWQDIALAMAYQIGGDSTAADAALKKLIDKHAAIAAYQVAEVYALRNDQHKTFEWLERAWSIRDTGITSLLNDPFILRYKDDPRFSAFCRKVGLPMPAEVERHT
ncbi:MAG: hypothetical protein QOK23_4336 [Gammaproteobacteria bacterium]|nr:hypothetical protein [Gammaproteobacteria bacterium]